MCGVLFDTGVFLSDAGGDVGLSDFSCRCDIWHKYVFARIWHALIVTSVDGHA